MPCVHMDSQGAGVEGSTYLGTGSFLGCPEPDCEGHSLGTRWQQPHKAWETTAKS